MEATATGGPPRFFALAAIGDGVVLAGTCGRGVSRSVDGGATWLPVPGGPDWVNDFAAAGPAGPAGQAGLVFAATERAGVHRSDDGGLTWTGTGLAGATTYAVLVDGASVLAGTGAGLQRSDDGGATWRAVGGLGATVYRLLARPGGGVLVGAGGRGVLLAGGEAVELVGLDGLTVYALAELPGGPILAGTKEAGLRRSDDDGATWVASGDGLPDELVHCLALDHDGAVLAGTGLGVARSGDGHRWAPVGGDLAERRVFSLAVDGGGVALGGSYDGVWRRTDGWSVVDTGLCDDAFAVAVVAGGDVLGGTAAGEVRASADGGASWRAAGAVDGAPHTFLRCADGRLLLGSDAGVLAAAGDRWVPAGLDGERVFRLLEPEPGVVLAATLGSGVHRWTDPGGWRPVPGIGERMALDLLATPSGTVLAGVAHVVAGAKVGGIHRSVDGGTTWRPAAAPPIAVYRLVRASTGTLLAGAQRSTILRSTDDGATWCELVTTGLPGAKTYALAIDGADRAYLGAGTGVWWSDDEGDTWTAVDSPALDGLTVFDLVAHPSGAVVAATSAGFLRTTDGGATWR